MYTIFSFLALVFAFHQYYNGVTVIAVIEWNLCLPLLGKVGLNIYHIILSTFFFFYSVQFGGVLLNAG